MDQRTKWTQVVEALNDTTLAKTSDTVFLVYQGALRAIKRQAKEYIDNYDVLSFAQRLEAERLLAVGDQIKDILDKATGTVAKTIKQGTAEQIANSYYGTYYALEGANNLNMPVTMLDKGYIDRIVNQPVEGKTLSRRLYQNRDRLAKTATQSLLQGAIDGRGYAYVAKRIEDLTEADYKRALRIARTEGGRASSLATQRAYEEAEEAGLDLQKTWVSTLDKKTRHSHQELDGQTVPIDDDFVSPITGAKGKGPRLLGRASEDINCRCTTITVVDGISPELRRDNETGETIQNMTYNEWLESKGLPKTQPKAPRAPKAEAPIEAPQHNVAQGNPMLNAHLDNNGKYAHDIEYVIDKQGYNGLPQVVDANTFDKAMIKSNFYAERTYAASSQDILEEYRKQLYEGDWYVDCSAGGAQYGQGMYAAAIYDLDDVKGLAGIRAEMRHYQELGIQRGNSVFATERITLTPDAKIFTMYDIDGQDLRQEWTTKAFIETLTDPKDIQWAKDHGELSAKVIKARAEYDSLFTKQYTREQKDELAEVYRKLKNEKRDFEENNWRLYEKSWEFRPDADLGVVAAELGYDAINATGHGMSGSYTVILNRTKVILQKGGK